MPDANDPWPAPAAEPPLAPPADRAPARQDGAPLSLDAVRLAWGDGAASAGSAALTDALRAVAADARARGAPVTELLRALDQLARFGGDGAAPDFERVRAWAGTQVICAYYAEAGGAEDRDADTRSADASGT